MTDDELLWWEEVRWSMPPEFWRDLGALCYRAWEERVP